MDKKIMPIDIGI